MKKYNKFISDHCNCIIHFAMQEYSKTLERVGRKSALKKSFLLKPLCRGI